VLTCLNFIHLRTLPSIQPAHLAEETILDLMSAPAGQLFLDLPPVLAVTVDEGNQQQILLDTPLAAVHVRLQIVLEVIADLLVSAT
jgi:hypothetical protein